MMNAGQVVALALFASGLLGCSSKVKGRFSSTGGDIGSYVQTPDRCESGGNSDFHGVVFFAGKSKLSVLEFVDDPLKGWFVKVDNPTTGKMLICRKQDCEVLEPKINVKRTRNSPQGIVSGSARFDCRTPGGGRVQGDLTFENCQ